MICCEIADELDRNGGDEIENLGACNVISRRMKPMNIARTRTLGFPQGTVVYRIPNSLIVVALMFLYVFHFFL